MVVQSSSAFLDGAVWVGGIYCSTGEGGGRGVGWCCLQCVGFMLCVCFPHHILSVRLYVVCVCVCLCVDNVGDSRPYTCSAHLSLASGLGLLLLLFPSFPLFVR